MKAVRRVLVIEDSDLAAITICRIVERAGYGVRHERTAAGGLQSVRDWSPHVLLLDRNLPDGDGIELAPLARAAGRPTMRIVLFTGDVISAAAGAGIDAVLRKPVLARDLLAAVGR